MHISNSMGKEDLFLLKYSLEFIASQSDILGFPVVEVSVTPGPVSPTDWEWQHQQFLMLHVICSLSNTIIMLKQDIVESEGATVSTILYMY